MMKNELRKKLGLYALSSGALIGLVENAGAQVIYTDFSDVTVNTGGGSYLVDLDGDNTDDFNLNIVVQGSNHLLYINTLTANAAVLQDPTVYNKATALASGDLLPANPTAPLVWGSSAIMAGHTPGSNYGDFKNVTNKYVGLRLKVNTDFQYGWLRLDANISTPTFTVKDMAYNQTLNEEINAGQIVNGVEDAQGVLENVSAFVNESNEVIFRNTTGKEVVAQIIGTDGKLMHSQSVGNGTSNVACELKAGIYMVRFTQDELMSTQKIFLQ